MFREWRDRLPVFIITWVVARLTFFLKPAHDMTAVGQSSLKENSDTVEV